MFRFLTIKDPHYMFGFRLSYRPNNFHSLISNKNHQLLEYAYANNINALFVTGDVFEKNSREQWSFQHYLSNKNELKKFIYNDFNHVLEFYTIFGNHDYFSGNEEKSTTVLGQLMSEKIIFPLNESGSFFGDNNEILVFGIDYHYDLNKTKDLLYKASELCRLYPEKFKIVVFHSNVADDISERLDDDIHDSVLRQQTKIAEFKYSQLIKEYQFDMFICGHWHIAPKQPLLKTIDNEGKSRYFINLWNFTRLVRDYYVSIDLHRPQFADVLIKKENDEWQVEWSSHYLKTAPFHEAFKIDILNNYWKLKKESKFEKTFEQFKTLFDQSGEDEFNFDLIIKQLEKEGKNISVEAVELVSKLLLDGE